MTEGTIVRDLPPERFFAESGEPRIQAFLAKIR
jgi:hypothetical protein